MLNTFNPFMIFNTTMILKNLKNYIFFFQNYFMNFLNNYKKSSSASFKGANISELIEKVELCSNHIRLIHNIMFNVGKNNMNFNFPNKIGFNFNAICPMNNIGPLNNMGRMNQINPINDMEQMFNMGLNNPGLMNKFNSINNMEQMINMDSFNNMGQMYQMNSFIQNYNNSKNIDIINNINYVIKDIIATLDKFSSKLIYALNYIDNPSNNYFEVNEIQSENEKLVPKIEKKVYELCNISDKIELETVGKFLYSVGGIARKSLAISNDIYHDLFEKYSKNTKLSNFNTSEKKNFSNWVKNYLYDNYFRDCCERNTLKIIKYLNKCPKESNFLKELFVDFLSLYLKCDVSIPFVEIKFMDNKIKEFDTKEMTDFFYKLKPTKVNFCFLPQLKSNGAVINGGKFYVFTYIEGKSFKMEMRDIDYENVQQKVM